MLRSVDGVRRLRSRLQLLEDLSEALGGIRCCGEVLVVHGGLEFLERAVDAGGVGAVQRVQDPVPDVVEGKDIPVDRGRVAAAASTVSWAAQRSKRARSISVGGR